MDSRTRAKISYGGDSIADKLKVGTVAGTRMVHKGDFNGDAS